MLVDKVKSSLTLKLNLLILLVGLFIIIIISFVFHFQANQSISISAKKQGLSIIDAVVIATESDSSFGNMRRVVSVFAAKDEIISLSIIDSIAGVVVANNDFSKNGKSVNAALNASELTMFSMQAATQKKSIRSVMSEGVLYLSKNFRFIDHRESRAQLYTILLTYDLTQAELYENTRFYQILVISGLGIIFMLVAVYVTQRFILIRPLANIVQTIQRQRFNAEAIFAEVRGNDELSTLVTVYNELNLKRCQQESQLKDARRYIDGLSNNTPVLMAYLDIHEVIRFVNSGFEARFAGGGENVVGKMLNDIFCVEDYSYLKPWMDMVRKGDGVAFEFSLEFTKGEFRYYQTSFRPDMIEGDEVQGFFMSMDDITDVVLTQTKLEEYTHELEYKHNALEIEKEKAQAAARSKSEFLACMSHEIRTPMNGVLGMIELILKGPLEASQQHKATLAKSSAESLLSLINDILDFSKVEAGRLEIESVPLDLETVFNEFSEAMAISAHEKGLEFVLDTSALSYSHVSGDHGRLRQILSNLVGNAIKFTSEGYVKVTVKSEHLNDSKIKLVCSITDTGIGIPKARQLILFDKFTQVDASTTRRFGGTGLGLAVVKSLCELMGGQIAVDSKPESGSEFTFNILLDVNSQTKLQEPLDFTERKILLLGQHRVSLELTQKQLEIWGAEVSAFGAGALFLDQVSKIDAEGMSPNVDLIILDAEVPDINGLDIARLIRTKASFNKTKVVLVTRVEYDPKVVTDDGQIVDALLTKPLTSQSYQFLTSLLRVECPETGNEKNNINSSELRVLMRKEGSSTPNQLVSGDFEYAQATPNAKILLVEDNLINQQVALGLLEDFGNAVFIASDGLEAINILRQTRLPNVFDLILMDCQMPNMDGYEAAQLIRSGGAGAYYINVPIIAMTANTMLGDKEKCIEQGMSDYISKPISPRILEEKVRQWLGEAHISINVNVSSFGQKTTMAGGAVWDYDSLLKRVKGEDYRAVKLVKAFIDSYPIDLAHLERTMTHADYDELACCVQKLKGVTKSIGAHTINVIFANIELAMQNGNVDKLQELQPELNDASRLLLQTLQSYIDSQSRPGLS